MIRANSRLLRKTLKVATSIQVPARTHSSGTTHHAFQSLQGFQNNVLKMSGVDDSTLLKARVVQQECTSLPFCARRSSLRQTCPWRQATLLEFKLNVHHIDRAHDSTTYGDCFHDTPR
jgi:hypothetical protein